MEKDKVVILGKIPPPFMGTSVWFETLRLSSLKEYFDIRWYNVNVHRGFSSLGKGSIRKIWPNIRLYFKFKRLITEFKPDLVLIPISQTTAGFLKDSLFISMAKKKARTLVMLHGSNLETWLSHSTQPVRKYFARTLSGCSGAIVLGNNLKYLFRKWFPDERIFIVPNGLNIDMTGIQKACSDRVILRFLANLSTAKGIRDTISAMALIRKPNEKLELRINGTWLEKDTKKWCTRLVHDEDLPVVFEGPIFDREKIEALGQSDIFIFPPTKPEGHPLVIIEAMAAGLPIITTDQGAISESVIDGVNGFIVMSNCPDKIAEKLRFLIENPEKRISMGSNSRRLYEEKFTEEIMIKNLSSVFNYILSRNN